MEKEREIVQIDSVERDKLSKVIYIRGWTANLDTESLPTTDVNADNTTDTTIFWENRDDVNKAFDLSNDFRCGFNIIINQDNVYSGKVDLSFDFDGRAQNVCLKLNQKICHPNEIITKNSSFLEKISKYISIIKKYGIRTALKKIFVKMEESRITYPEWIRKNESYDETEVQTLVKSFEYTPKISIIVPVYNIDETWLVKCIDSVVDQVYTNWELCIADDASTVEYIKPFLEKLIANDERIKVIFRKENGHISRATNSALGIATGDYVAFLDNDDELSPYALFENVKELNRNHEIDILYSDEDKISESGKRTHPYFKSDWAPDTIMGNNYIGHFLVVRKSLVSSIGGFRVGFEGAQDHDLILRATEKTDKIRHIPKILYHWRMLDSSTAANTDSKNYAVDAGKLAIESALTRRGLKGQVKPSMYPGFYVTSYDVKKQDKVSVIIPMRDHVEDTKKCIESIIEKTRYNNYEIIIADNGSKEKATADYFDVLRQKYSDKIRVIPMDIPFNFSKINNIAAKSAEGAYLLFLNNDTEVINSEWIDNMLGYAQLNHVGAVGAKLYYFDNTIQHSGVVLGLGGIAGHIHYNFAKNDPGYFGKLVIPTNYLAVTAACLMVKKKDFDEVGGFDENLVVAFNDVDFCVKLFDQLHLYNVVTPNAELYHYESKSRGYEDTPQKQKRFERETKILQSKWKKYIAHDPFYNPNLTRKYADYTIRQEE